MPLFLFLSSNKTKHFTEKVDNALEEKPDLRNKIKFFLFFRFCVRLAGEP